jgi:Trypsin
MRQERSFGNPIRIGVARLGIAAAALLIIAVAWAAQSSAAGPASTPGSQRERSSQAGEVELALSRTGIVSKLEAGLGDAFGGLWFDQSTAQLHVGVTSPASRQKAEAVAAQAGMAANVTETPVRSTWAQLEAAQSHWDGLLSGRAAQEAVSTSLAPESNSVQVELGSSVPPAKLAELERATGDAAVDVDISVVAHPRRLNPYARCKAFAKFEAFCDPTMVSGVSIAKKEEAKQGVCTAGPLAIRKSPGTTALATETFVLTAGHCIEGEISNWWAFKMNGESKKIGKALAALQPTEGAGYDVGVIEIEAKSVWANLNLEATPVKPVIANWAAGKEPFPVIKQENPTKGTKVCYSGQRTGTQCGEVKEVNVKFVDAGFEWKEAVKVQLEGGKKASKGDSGSPLFSKAGYEKEEGFVQAMLLAGETEEPPFEESNIVYFQSLSKLFEKLNEKTAYNLELLTTANQKRP